MHLLNPPEAARHGRSGPSNFIRSMAPDVRNVGRSWSQIAAEVRPANLSETAALTQRPHHVPA